MRKRVVSLKDKDVNYVLTVPAIWNDMAKRFMREAAVEVFINYHLQIQSQNKIT